MTVTMILVCLIRGMCSVYIPGKRAPVCSRRDLDWDFSDRPDPEYGPALYLQDVNRK